MFFLVFVYRSRSFLPGVDCLEIHIHAVTKLLQQGNISHGRTIKNALPTAHHYYPAPIYPLLSLQ